MDTIAIVKTMKGIFYAKDPSGNVRELKIGDDIFLNEVIFDAKDNDSNANLVASIIGSDLRRRDSQTTNSRA